MTESRLTALVGMLYEAVENEALWPAVLEQIGDCFGGAAAGFTVDDRNSHQTHVARAVRLDPDSIKGYSEYYHQIDLFTQKLRPHQAPGRALASHAYISDHELSRSEYFNDFLKKQSLFYNMGAAVALEPKSAAYLTVLRSKEAGAFTGNELDTLTVLLPHLSRALRMQSQSAALHRSYDALDSLPDSLVLIEACGSVVFANKAAIRVFDEKDGLELAPTGLLLASADGRSSLSACCSRTASTIRGAEKSDLLVASRPSGKRPYLLRFHPLRSSSPSLAFGRATGAVFITDTDGQSRIDVNALHLLFGLSPAELRLASLLAGGDDLTEASEELAISRNTARTQLRSIFDKTGVRRQTELILLISRVCVASSP